jgi:pimeloyl-ACP methyl ester carboxylesterase
MQRLLCSPLGFLVSWLLNERKFHKSFAEVFGAETQPTVQELHDFWTCIVHNDGPAVVHRISRYQQERRRNYERWVGALRDTSVPFLGIFGETDPVSGVHMAEAIARLRSPDEMVRLPHIGHYPQTEAPGAVLEAYRGFRQRLQ